MVRERGNKEPDSVSATKWQKNKRKSEEQ